jgi:hypothetical protein
MSLFVPWFPVAGAGYTLQFYQNSTTTPITIYSDSALMTPQTNPVTSAALPDGSYGFPTVFLKQIYNQGFKIVLKNAAGTTVMTVDGLTVFISANDLVSAAGVSSSSIGITYTDAGASAGPSFIGFRDSASPAAADLLRDDWYTGRNSVTGAVVYVKTGASIVDPVSGTEDGQWFVQTYVAGTLADRVRIRDRIYLMIAAAETTVPYMLTGTATYDPPSLADGVGTTTTVTVTGAALGDFAKAAFSLDTSGITITAWVSSTNTVSVRFQNESGGTLDIASGTLKCGVFK